MTQYTAPDLLPIPEASDIIAPLEEDISDLALAMQASLLRPASVATDAQRNAAIPNPQPGQRVWRTDKLWEEMYFAAGPVRVAGWFPTNGAIPHCRLYKTSDANITGGGTGGLVGLTWVLDTTTATGFKMNTSSYVVAPVTGWYRISGCIHWAANATGYRAIQLTTTAPSGTAGVAFSQYVSIVPAVSVGLYQLFSKDIYLEAGSNISIAVGQNSGSGLNVLGDSGTEMTVTYVKPA